MRNLWTTKTEKQKIAEMTTKRTDLKATITAYKAHELEITTAITEKETEITAATTAGLTEVESQHTAAKDKFGLQLIKVIKDRNKVEVKLLATYKI